MPGAAQYAQLGPNTFEVSVAVTGGMLVMVDAATGKVKPTTGIVTNCVGVALADANPAGTDPTNPINLGGYARPEVAVAHAPAEVYVTYTSTAVFGDLLVSAASGQVAPIAAVTTPTAGDVSNTRSVVGKCTEPAGVTAGAVGRMRLYV